MEADKRVTPEMFLAGQTEARLQVDNAANRLKWMLKDTMGSDGAFERRAIELELLTGTAPSEDDVVESYRREVDPAAGVDAFMLRYLQYAQMAYIFGHTIFVHGGINEACLGNVPGEAGIVPDVHEWVTRLNAWARKEVSAFEQDPYTGGNSASRAGHALMDYCVPGGNGNRTVVPDSSLRFSISLPLSFSSYLNVTLQVYADFLQNGNAVPLPAAVEHFLTRGGVTGVMAGHKPHGDCPNVIRSGSVTVITGDTSYSHLGHKSSWGVDNRGDHVRTPLTRTDASTIYAHLPARPSQHICQRTHAHAHA
jgi:hypothetical protein